MIFKKIDFQVKKMSTKLKNKLSRKITESKRSAGLFLERNSASLRRKIGESLKNWVYNRKQWHKRSNSRKFSKSQMVNLPQTKNRIKEIQDHKKEAESLSGVNQLKKNYESDSKVADSWRRKIHLWPGSPNYLH